jgi:hypothetical protein
MKKTIKSYSRYTVIRDTREQASKGWFFETSDRCAGTDFKKLDVGDYSLLGFESLVTIERKGSVAEFCGNLTQERFIAPYDPTKSIDKQSEFVRLESIHWPFIILEFDVNDLLRYPNLPEIPPKLRYSIKFKGPAALKKVIELQMMYKTKILFCGRRGKDVASSIFKRVIEEIEKNNVKV